MFLAGIIVNMNWENYFITFMYIYNRLEACLHFCCA